MPTDLQFFDIPLLFQDSKEGFQFIESLDQQKNVDIFSRKSIQRIINYRWKQWQNKFYLKLFIPYLILLLCYNIRSYTGNLGWTSPTEIVISFITSFFIIVLPIYFLVLEFIIMMKNPRKYFSNVLFLLRVTPYITLLTLTGLILYRKHVKKVEEDIVET